ncbi:hypothetical protein F5I97DRAFT_584098 [Phlebopus sp. FC_14]|nr:hypothetical protein F5I97DRAFT_584098 [Phlebopus sp. FC_14]
MITIDLTLDDSPIRGREYAHTVVSKEKAAQPAAEAIAVELKTEVTDTDVVGDMAEGFSTHVTQSPPRRKHLSVTFASPVGNVERESANSQSEATRRSFETRCVQTDAGTEYGHSVDYETPGHPNNTMDVVPNVLGTLPRIKYTPPNQGVGLRFTPLKNLSEMNMSVHRPCSLFEPKASRGPGHNATGDDVDVKEIVDVSLKLLFPASFL